MENAPSTSASSLDADAMEAKRKRLMKKVELAKQGWTGLGTAGEPIQCQTEGDDLDTTPYEEIDEDDEEAADDTVLRRPPVGELPSFIPLSRDSDEEDGGDAEVAVTASLSVAKDDGVAAAAKVEEEFEERLI